MRQIITAFILYILLNTTSTANESYRDIEAEDAVNEYLRLPTLEKYDNLLHFFGKDWVRRNNRTVKVSSVDWTQYLKGKEKKMYLNELPSRTQKILKSSIPTFEKYELLKLLHSHTGQVSKWNRQSSLLFEEAMGKTKTFNQDLFEPGDSLFRHTIDKHTQVLVAGTIPVLITNNSVSYIDLDSKSVKFLTTLKSKIQHVYAGHYGIWIEFQDKFIFIDGLLKIYDFHLAKNFRLIGRPLLGPDYVVAPLITGQSPAEFSINTWNLDGTLLHNHPVFNRFDRKGRLRNQLWLPGPLNKNGFCYLSHCGVLVQCSIGDAKPHQLIPYDSLNIESTLLQLQEHTHSTPFFKPCSTGDWFFKAQDSHHSYQLNLNDWSFHKSTIPTNTTLPLFDKKNHCFLDKNGRPIALLPGENGCGTWIPCGNNYIYLQGNNLKIVRHLKNSSVDSVETLARQGITQKNSDEELWQNFYNHLNNKTALSWNHITQYLNHPHLPSANKWIPQILDSLTASDRAKFWKWWQNNRELHYWPLANGLLIPPLLLGTHIVPEGSLPTDFDENKIIRNNNVRDKLKQLILHPGYKKRSQELKKILNNTIGLGPKETQLIREINDINVKGPWRLGTPLFYKGIDINTLLSSYSTPSWDMVLRTTQTHHLWKAANPDALNKVWPHSQKNKILSGDITEQLSGIVYQKDNRILLKLRDSKHRIWNLPIALSSESKIYCIKNNFCLLDPQQGKGWILEETGNILFTFPLLEDGPFNLYSNENGLLIVGSHFILNLTQLNRAVYFDKWSKNNLTPLETLTFQLQWQQIPNKERFASLNKHPLATRLQRANQHLRERYQPRKLTSSTSHETFMVNGILDDAYDESQRLSLHGAEKSYVYAISNDKGILLGISVIDETFVKAREENGEIKGDIINIGWDPRGDGKWWSEQDDRKLTLGLFDPQAIKIGKVNKNAKKFAGDISINHNERLKTTVYECFIPYEVLGHQLPVRLNIIWQDDDGDSSTWHSLGSSWNKTQHIPRLMPYIMPAQ